MEIVTTLARSLYDYLLPAGVRIHEFRERPLHAKVAVFDRQLSTVGSSNLDPLSLALNLESNLLIDDAGFAAELRARLDGLMDTTRCQLVCPSDVPARTWWATLRMRLVLFALRRFPAWAGWLPAHRPRLVPVAPDPLGG
jgi:cardiolipin synthase